jgi:hypothetical protein
MFPGLTPHCCSTLGMAALVPISGQKYEVYTLKRSKLLSVLGKEKLMFFRALRMAIVW